ncbi:MAG: hypothetical protein ACTSQY_02075 [Candidatus Odinarchaeia archaeon]
MNSITQRGRFFISKEVNLGRWDWDLLKCMVCKTPIKNTQQKIFCPYCGNPAHKSHLLEWLKIKSVCPICGRKLKITDLVGD